MGLDVEINIETIKGQIKLIKTTQELQLYYRVILDEIRDLEFKREEIGIKDKIVVLEDILDMIGNMLLSAGEDC
jgi:hypothetical protein